MGSFELIFSDFDSEIPPGEVLRSDSVISIQKFTQGGVLNSDSVISILKLPQGGVLNSDSVMFQKFRFRNFPRERFELIYMYWNLKIPQEGILNSHVDCWSDADMLMDFQTTTTCGNAYSVHHCMINYWTTNNAKAYEYVMVDPSVN